METAAMGRLITEATIENMEDLWAKKRALIPTEQVRKVTVSDALVDTGATLLSLPTRLIQQLGLEKMGTRRVSSSTGGGEAALYGAVRLTIQNRACTMDVMDWQQRRGEFLCTVQKELLEEVVEKTIALLSPDE